MRSHLCRFLADDSGATAIEYGLIAVGICLALVVSVQTLGTDLAQPFTDVSTGLTN